MFDSSVNLGDAFYWHVRKNNIVPFRRANGERARSAAVKLDYGGENSARAAVFPYLIP